MHDTIWKQIHDNSSEGFALLESIRNEFGEIIDFTWVYMNAAGEKILPPNRRGLTGKKLLDVSSRSKENGIFDEYVKVTETAETSTCERMYSIDNSPMWIRTIIVKVNDGIGITFSDITLQKKLELQLRENESYLRSITESIPQLVWITRPDGYHEYFNSRWYDYTSTSYDETKGEGWNKILHPDDQENAWRVWTHSLQTGESYEIEYRLLNGKTKEYRWFLARALPIRNDNNEIVRWFGTCTDIHEQKVTYESQLFLAEASKLLSSVFDYRKALQKVSQLAVDHVTDWISIELFDGTEVELAAVAHKDPNKIKWAKQLRKESPIDLGQKSGLPEVLRTGKPILYPLITEQMIQSVVKTEKELLLIQEIGFTSLMIVPIVVSKKTVGAVQFVSTSSKRQFGKNDLQMAEEFAGRIGLSIQSSMYYEEIVQRDKQLQVLYDSNLIGVSYVKANGTVLSANNAFFALVGYTRQEFERKNIKWQSLIPLEYSEIEAKKTKELYETGIATPFEKEYIRKDGSQVPVIVGKTLINKKTGDYVAFILDITERKKLEARKDEFIGIASHELKTPLTSIKGYVQILERIIKEMGDEKARALVSKTNIYIDKLDSLIVDLLDVSKIQAGKIQFSLEKLDISELVKESVSAIQPTTQHKISLKSKIKGLVEGDRQRLEQVLANLLTNAIKYSPKGKEVIVNISRDESFVYVHVQDFGIGIEEQYQKLLFQRFYRVEASSRQFSGLGIGLYISSEIITRHGGKIWLDSVSGVGSTFHFSLPLVNGKKIV